jgi:transcription initiation factor TFIIB
MRREQTRGRWRSKAEQNLAHGLGEVRRLASALDLSDTLRDQACQLFWSAQNQDLLRGRSIEAITAASVYGACRSNGRSQLLTLNEELGLPAKSSTPMMYISRLASDLNCPDRIRRRARALAEAAEDAGVTTGVHPAGFAAARLYKAGQEAGRWLTQTEIAEVANTLTASSSRP